ncbi:hypothetical protein TKK_0017590 [Trichogramma kaykai]
MKRSAYNTFDDDELSKLSRSTFYRLKKKGLNIDRLLLTNGKEVYATEMSTTTACKSKSFSGSHTTEEDKNKGSEWVDDKPNDFLPQKPHQIRNNNDQMVDDMKKDSCFELMGNDENTFLNCDKSKERKKIYCSSCQKKVSVQDNNFLVTLDIADDVRNVLEKNEDYYHYVMHDRPQESNCLQDICDGKMFKKFVNSLPEEDTKSFISCTFNSDGSLVFKSSTYSIWPIQICINEVPAEVRQKNTITWALWFGKNKPDMNVFMNVFVNNIKFMSTEGITCKIKNELLKIKLYALCCCVDSVARSPMQGVTQFNGRYGCNWCLHPGVPVKNKNSNKTTLKYTVLDHGVALRDSVSTIKHMEEAFDAQKPVMGVMKPAALINLPKFDIIRGFVPDGMHCIFLGVCKQFATYWFDVAGTLYYIPPKEKYHWQLLVDSCHILMGEKVMKDDLHKVNEKLKNFVVMTQDLYSKRAMTFNVHQLLHLVQSVADWGPLWAHHGYPFEDGNEVKNKNYILSVPHMYHY